MTVTSTWENLPPPLPPAPSLKCSDPERNWDFPGDKGASSIPIAFCRAKEKPLDHLSSAAVPGCAGGSKMQPAEPREADGLAWLCASKGRKWDLTSGVRRAADKAGLCLG